MPSNNSVFPEPNLPHTRESSPCGKFNDKSTRRNLCFGVDAADGAKLLALRSCGHVKVQDWNATVLDCWSRGGTAFTSAPLRYFSIRWRETKLWTNYEDTYKLEGIKNMPEAFWWKFQVKHWAQISSPRKLHKKGKSEQHHAQSQLNNHQISM